MALLAVEGLESGGGRRGGAAGCWGWIPTLSGTFPRAGLAVEAESGLDSPGSWPGLGLPSIHQVGSLRAWLTGLPPVQLARGPGDHLLGMRLHEHAIGRAMCSPHESINSRMAPGAARPLRLVTDMVQARASDCCPVDPLCLRDVVLFRVQTGLAAVTRPWLSLCVLSAPSPGLCWGNSLVMLSIDGDLPSGSPSSPTPSTLSLRSRQKVLAGRTPPLLPLTLADLDCSLRDLEPAPASGRLR